MPLKEYREEQIAKWESLGIDKCFTSTNDSYQMDKEKYSSICVDILKRDITNPENLNGKELYKKAESILDSYNLGDAISYYSKEQEDPKKHSLTAIFDDLSRKNKDELEYDKKVVENVKDNPLEKSSEDSLLKQYDTLLENNKKTSFRVSPYTYVFQKIRIDLFETKIKKELNWTNKELKEKLNTYRESEKNKDKSKEMSAEVKKITKKDLKDITGDELSKLTEDDIAKVDDYKKAFALHTAKDEHDKEVKENNIGDILSRFAADKETRTPIDVSKDLKEPGEFQLSPYVNESPNLSNTLEKDNINLSINKK